MISNLSRAGSYDRVIDKYWSKDNSIFKPLWTFEQDEFKQLSYYEGYGRSYKGFKNIKESFKSLDLTLKLYICKPNVKFIAGGGTLILKNNDSFISLFIICDDENAVYLINPLINTFTGLKTMVATIIKENVHKADTIWTNDIDSYCFTQVPKVRFKSFLEQKQYYQYLADEWINTHNKSIKAEPKQEQMAF